MTVNFRELSIEEQRQNGAIDTRPADDKHAFFRLVFALSAGKRTVMLSKQEEFSAIQAWVEHGDRKALDKLTRAFLPMITQMAKRIASYNRCERQLDDLVQAGNVAFVEGLPKFDAELGNRLSTYISCTIAGAMHLHCMQLKLPVRTGTSAAEKRAFFKYKAVVSDFRQNHGYRPTDGAEDIARLAEAAGVTHGAMKRARTTHHARVYSLNQVELWTDEETRQDAERIRTLLISELRALGDKMSERDRAIAVRAILLQTGDGFQAIARQHDLTVERIRQIRRSAIAFIRESLQAKGITGASDLMDVA